MNFKNLLLCLTLWLGIFTFISKAQTLDECEDFKAFLSNKKININTTVERCSVNGLGKANAMTLHDLTFTQDIIDKITSYIDIYEFTCMNCSYGQGLNYDSFKKLTTMTFLELIDVKKCGYELTTIPESFYTFSNLRKLVIQNNGITTIPSKISKLKNLENLDLSHNSITNIDSVVKFKYLTSLFINNNAVTTIPKKIGNLKNLEIIDLSYNKITNLPDTLSKLSKLFFLDIRDNKINAEIPESLNTLPSLDYIDLRNNANLTGKTLTNESLRTCLYNYSNKSKYSLCMAKPMTCFGDYDLFKSC